MRKSVSQPSTAHIDGTHYVVRSFHALSILKGMQFS